MQRCRPSRNRALAGKATTPASAPPCTLQNQFDSIDLSDNAIVRLDGFPKLTRLQALHLNNNRILKIGRGLEGGRGGEGCCMRAGLAPRHTHPHSPTGRKRL